MQHFVEDYLLDSQSADVKKAATFVAELMRTGKGKPRVSALTQFIVR